MSYSHRTTVKTVLIAAAMMFAAVMAFYWLSQSIAAGQPAPNLDAGAAEVQPAAGDIATAPAAKPPESVPAAPVVAAPDPTYDPGGFVDAVRKLWSGGALVPAVLLALYGVLLLARSKVTWLQTGKRAVYTAAILTFLTGCAEAASRGNTPTLGVIVGALFGAITLALQPVPKKVAEPIA
jgi:hypothetical protein